ncbi:MAG: HD-GYP domain-containing protein [Vicinamibacteraceae bacterium]
MFHVVLRRRQNAGAAPAAAPRFVVRVVAIAFATVVGVLAAISAVLVLETRAVVERGIATDLAAAQRQLAASHGDRQREASLRASLISSSPTLKTVLETYQEQRNFGADAVAREQLDALQREIDRVASLLRSDGLAVVGLDGRVVVSAGPSARSWPAGTRLLAIGDAESVESDQVIATGGEPFRVTVAPIAAVDGVRLALLVEGRRLDIRYANELAGEARSQIAVLVDGRLVASTSTGPALATLAASLRRAGVPVGGGTFEAAGEQHGYLLVQQVGPAAIYAVASITAARDEATAAAIPRLVAIVAGGLLLCLLASISLARRVAAPIDRVSRDIHAMVISQAPAPVARRHQAIKELDDLGASFSNLLQTVHEARAETSAAYLGAVQALVAALDARDPYTAGHSERVSLLSVAIGHAMGLGQDDLDVLRLGALLHDIGKIGISDAILTKPATLTAEEFEAIKRHTLLGAQILRPISFLAAHVPLVELHHERPDGAGYPHGLRGDAIPIHARIVHVADAFDAMTTGRAYRAARPASDAVGELWRHAGTDFDVPSLQGLASLVSRMDAAALVAPVEPSTLAVGPAGADAEASATVLPFERRVS